MEKKNQNEMIIPFHQSPKIIISTNYTIAGSDDSTLDRQFVVEFSDHYNKSHRPIDEFGHRFFNEWSGEEWNSFNNYMIGCMQLYLNRGLVDCGHVNLERKKLIDSTSEEFAEFFENIELGKEVHKKILFENFKREYEEYEDMQPVRFSRWIREAAKIKGVKVKERKTGMERYVRIGESEAVD